MCTRTRQYLFLLLLISFASLTLADKTRMVILGFDGADAKLTQKWIAAGKLPNMAQLQQQGIFQPLATTNPAHSPVAWASFATGNNPGKHRIFGFLKRGHKKYHPEYALARVEQHSLWGNFYRISLAILCGLLISGVLTFAAKKLAWRKSLTIITALSFGLLVIVLLSYSLLKFFPQQIPVPVGLKEGKSFWEITALNKVPTEVLMAPISFPAKAFPGGKLLCGFGVPDINGTNGTWFRFSTRYNHLHTSETGGWKIPLSKQPSSFEGTLIGPKNLLVKERYQKLNKQLSQANFRQTKKIRNELNALEKQSYMTQKLSLTMISSTEATLEICGHSEKLTVGKWSKWLTIYFKMGPFLKIHGMVRCHLMKLDPSVELYITPIQFHPSKLPSNVSISHPKDFADNIAKKNGLYPTLGWSAPTNSLKDNAITEQMFWQDLKYNIKIRRKILDEALTRKDWNLLVDVFYFTDRAGHMYWRFLDKEHPRYQKDHESKDKLLKTYQYMDEIIGQTQKKLAPGDVLIVVSDHGFASFRQEINVNTWLYQQGYLALKENNSTRHMQVHDLFTQNGLLEQVDWSNTKAYSIGLGKIFLNLKGRDPQGIVSQQNYDSIRREIAEKLQKFRYQNKNVVKKVYLREEIMKGPFVEETADLFIGFEKGYRVSWQTTLGGIPQKIVEDNVFKWSGDHCSVDPDLVPGIFMCNYKISPREVLHICDIAPSVVKFFGIEIVENKQMDGNIFQILKK